MRISTLRMFELGTHNVTSKLEEQVNFQQQLSTGRRVLTPADDPVASARALNVENSRGRLEQFDANAGLAQDSLRELEGQLGGVRDAMQRLNELAIQTGNGALSDNDLKGIAAEVEARFNELLGIGNALNSDGHYLFSGYQGQTQPFVTATDPLSPLPTVSYAGDQGIREIQISESRLIEISKPGEAVFGVWTESAPGVPDTAPNAADTSLFAAVKALHDVANTGRSSATFQADLDAALSGIHAAQDRIGLVLGDIGAGQNEAETTVNANSDLALQFKTEFSNLMDVDYAATISSFLQSQQLLEVSRKTYQQVQGLSLFNFL